MNAEQKNAMNREVMKRQQQILKFAQRILNGKHLKKLQDFSTTGKAPGSKEYHCLPKKVQEIVLKLNIAGLEIMLQHRKNPLRKLQLMVGLYMSKKMAKTLKDNK